MLRPLLIVSLLLALLGATGCGGGDSSDSLPIDDQVVVANFEADVATTVLDGSGYESLLTSMDRMIALARAKPDAVYETDAFEDSPAESRTLRQVLADAASTLQPYQPDLAAQLDRARETLD